MTEERARAIEALEKAGFVREGKHNGWRRGEVFVTITSNGRCHVAHLPLADLPSLLSPSLTMEMVRNVQEQTLSTIEHAPNWTHYQWMVAIDVMNMFEARLRQQMEKSRPAVEQ